MTTGRPTRTRHDEWSKRALALWLRKLGDVQLDARISGEGRRGDVLFMERGADPELRAKLGLLGELARGRVLFEPFRNPPNPREIKACLAKAIELEAHALRAARRAKRPAGSVETPLLCIITPSMSRELAAEAGAVPMAGQKPGIYRLAPMLRTVIVVAAELPKGPDTLWLRLFGRDVVQGAAVQELDEMADREPLRDATLELLVAWGQSLPPDWRSDDELELQMNLERVYERWERKTIAKGKAEGKVEGKAQGKAEAVLMTLETRGLAVTAAERDRVLACTDLAQLDAWVRGAVTAASAATLLGAAAKPAARRPAARKPRSPRG